MNRRELALGVFASAMAGSAVIQSCTAAQGNRKRVLVVNQAAGFRHSSIPVATMCVRYLGMCTQQWEVVQEASNAEQVARAITAENLKNVDMVFFANTTGNLGFTPAGREEFYAWIRAGGAFAGVHSAGDTFHDDPLYLDLVRGEFSGHGPQLKVKIYNQDPNHPACAKLPATFEIFDEIYEYKNWDRAKVHVLLSMKVRPRPGSQEMGDFPVAWTNRMGQGRMFYTSLGHREDVYMNGLFIDHFVGGMRWALGLANGDDRPGNPIV